ncbi:putative DnaA family protein [Moraxella macacae 0408225]|uniref:Putative DnaA family protein n=1 Tax=Moraxella macacae 0408225 TaxID=1230338 RepID=L2F4T4_9GAMM|nr:DnaA/Hda family protein [Moraxella macacae]ELA08044.1 putative DnaA family protein [Moraxella macacae 0408225]
MAEQQLSLYLDIKQDASISDFVGPGWMAMVDMVRQLHIGLLSQIYLYGDADTGKTHLLSAICESFRDSGKSVMYLSLKDLLTTDPMVLNALESMEVIAIDDIDSVEGYDYWQEAIFHLINLSNEYGHTLIFTSRKPVGQLDFKLKDLVSRLAKSATFQLPSGANRQDRELILQAVLKRRNWHFDPRIIEHLLAKGPERIGAMLDVLTCLQPIFSNVRNITKAKIAQAAQIIDEQTLLHEVKEFDFDEEESFLDF